jgi:hypothetical protein
LWTKCTDYKDSYHAPLETRHSHILLRKMKQRKAVNCHRPHMIIAVSRIGRSSANSDVKVDIDHDGTDQKMWQPYLKRCKY